MVRPCSTAMSKNYRRVDSRKDQERWRFFFWVSCAVERGAWVTFNCLLMIVLFKMNLTAGILFWSFKSYGMSPEVHSANRNDPWLSDLYPFRRHLQTWAVPGLASEKMDILNMSNSIITWFILVQLVFCDRGLVSQQFLIGRVWSIRHLYHWQDLEHQMISNVYMAGSDFLVTRNACCVTVNTYDICCCY